MYLIQFHLIDCYQVQESAGFLNERMLFVQFFEILLKFNESLFKLYKP